MGEQTSAKELWASLIDLYCKIEETQPGGHNIRKLLSLGDEACIARILADRKETVERCREVCLYWVRNLLPNAYRFKMLGIESEDLRKAFDAILKEMK